jgi:hypothetical protein
MNPTSSLINIGGVGSCVLSQVLRNLNYQCYPYDWNATYASFVIKSILDLSPLFIFEKIYYTSPPLFVNKSIRNNDNTAWDIHSFKNSFESDVENISEKYNRRLIRLKEKLYSDDNKLLIRMMHTLDSDHPEINNNKEKDSLEKWLDFYDIINSKYKNIKLILISQEDSEIYYKNIKDGIVLINDKELFNNQNDKLFNFLKDVNYINI